MSKPAPPSVPEPALRSQPDTFSDRVEANVTFWSTLVEYMSGSIDYIEALANVLITENLPSLTGKAFYIPFVNSGESGIDLLPTTAYGRSLLEAATIGDFEDLTIRPGTPRHFYHDVAAAEPADWTRSDGTKRWLRLESVVSRTDYADLFTLYGETYGAGDGTTTFKLPGFLGAFEREWDYDTSGGTAAGRDPDTRALQDYQADDFKSHTHTYDGTESGDRGAFDANEFDQRTGNSTGATGGDETRPKNGLRVTFIKT